MTLSRTYKTLALVLCVLPVFFFLFGCKAEHLESSGEDDAFLRLPGAKPEDVPMEDGPLLLTAPGTRWTYATRTELRSDDASKPMPQKTGEEQMVVLGAKTVGKSTGTAFKIYQDGKAFREEVFRLDAEGLSLVAAGINNGPAVDTMAITPGIPLIEFPVREGAIASWEGILRLLKNNIQAPGYAHSRISAREIMELPLGKAGTMTKMGVYKVETIISTTVEGRPIYLYSARWFAPSIGIVRQVVVTGNQVITKNLVRFERAGSAARVASTH